MRTLSSPTATEIANPVTRPGYLVSIGFASPLRMTTSGTAVNWDSAIWLPYDLKVQGLRWDGKGEQSATLLIGNTDLVLSALVLNEGVADRAVSIWQFYGDATASADPVPVFNGAADDCEIMPDKVTIRCATQHLRGLFAPRRYITPEQGFHFVPAAGTVLNWNGEQYEMQREER